MGHFTSIVLTGFMGSGKTTVGKLLAERLRWEFADLDAVVEARVGKTVPEIFAEAGEDAFRQAEIEALDDLLEGSHQVIALGGGAATVPQVRERLRNDPWLLVVHLLAPFEILYERCRAQALDSRATERPLFAERGQFQARHLERLPFYAEIATWQVDVGECTPEEAAEEIVKRLAVAASDAKSGTQ